MMELKDNLLFNFDSDLQRFYLKALSKELNVLNKRNALNIKQALQEVVKAYMKNSGEHSFRFDSSIKRCAYVIKHCPCFTSAVARHMLKLVEENSRVLDNAIIRGVVNVCCLGGGPASDAVAVGKILSILYRPYWLATGKPLNLKFTVLDVNEDWDITAGNVMSTFCDYKGILGVDGVTVSFEFLKADLTETLKGKVKEVVKSADLLTMVYFLSAVNRGRDCEISLQMIRDIMSSMKVNAFLFFLDSAAEVQYRQMNDAAESLKFMERIYGPRLEDFHTLTLESMKTFLELYKTHFRRFMCLTNCFVSAGSWYKTSEHVLCVKRSTRISEEAYITEQPLQWRNSQRNRSASELTSKMVAFRSEVAKLVDAEFEKDDEENYLSSEEFRDFEFDDSWEDTEVLRARYEHRVPAFLFQSKSKKKRIFTGLSFSN